MHIYSALHKMSAYLDQSKIGWNTFPPHLLAGNAQLYQDKLFSAVRLTVVLTSASLKLKGALLRVREPSLCRRLRPRRTESISSWISREI